MNFIYFFGKLRTKLQARVQGNKSSMTNRFLMRAIDMFWHCFITLAGLSVATVVVGFLFVTLVVSFPCAIVAFSVELFLDGRRS
jgi:hypothetical protein